MATVTKVRQGGSSTDLQSEDFDFERDTDREEEINLESVHLDRDGGGWKVTITHDRNGRPSKQVEKFDSYAEAHDYCDPGEDKEEEK